MAQQIHTIQHAVANNIKSFQFEGVELSLNASCSIFITMNTMSYADRGVRNRIFENQNSSLLHFLSLTHEYISSLKN